MMPVFLLTVDAGTMLARPEKLIFHAGVQGLVAGVIAIIAFGKSVATLGAGRADMFPAMVPVNAVMLGIPMLDEWPSLLQSAGVVLSTVGLVIAAIPTTAQAALRFS